MKNENSQEFSAQPQSFFHSSNTTLNFQLIWDLWTALDHIRQQNAGKSKHRVYDLMFSFFTEIFDEFYMDYKRTFISLISLKLLQEEKLAYVLSYLVYWNLFLLITYNSLWSKELISNPCYPQYPFYFLMIHWRFSHEI